MEGLFTQEVSLFDRSRYAISLSLLDDPFWEAVDLHYWCVLQDSYYVQG